MRVRIGSRARARASAWCSASRDWVRARARVRARATASAWCSASSDCGQS